MDISAMKWEWDQIDALLLDFRAQIDNATTNIVDACSLPVFDEISRRRNLLTGQTKQVVVSSFDAFNELFGLRGQANDLLVKAEAERAKGRVPVVGGNKDEIKRLVTEDLIQVDSQVVDLAHRAFTGASKVDKKISLATFFSSAEPTYKQGMEAILAFEKASETLQSQLVAATSEVEPLRQQFLALNLALPPDFTELSLRLSNISQAIKLDPIGTVDDFQAQISPLVQKIKDAIGSLQQQKQLLEEQKAAVQAAIDAVKLRVAALRLLQQSCNLKWQQCLEDITDAPQCERHPEKIDYMEKIWLPKLQEAFNQGFWQKLGPGLTNCQAMACECEDLEKTALKAYAELVEERLRLRDLLEMAHDRARRLKLDSNNEMQAIYLQAQLILYHRPDQHNTTSLPEARTVLANYQAKLSELSATI